MVNGGLSGDKRPTYGAGRSLYVPFVAPTKRDNKLAIRLNDDEKKRITDAADLDYAETSSWSRAVLLREADRRLAEAESRPKRRK